MQCEFLAEKWIDGFPSAVSWVKDPFSKSDATVDVAYTDSIREADIYNFENKDVLFSKISGPAWLSISESGMLTGTPFDSDIGQNTFIVQAAYDTNLSEQASLEIEVFTNTSTGEESSSEAVTVYPNPVSDIINVEGTIAAYYMIHDLIGIKLLEGDHTRSVDASSLKSGMYFITVNDQVIRFIKK